MANNDNTLDDTTSKKDGAFGVLKAGQSKTYMASHRMTAGVICKCAKCGNPFPVVDYFQIYYNFCPICGEKLDMDYSPFGSEYAVPLVPKAFRK